MEDMNQQLPKTNAEWLVYYQSILAELTENQKIGEPISPDEFFELPIKRKQNILKNCILKIGDAE